MSRPPIWLYDAMGVALTTLSILGIAAGLLAVGLVVYVITARVALELIG